jgi:hypothetical protein
MAAQPNGYFADDLTPAEHYALAERLRSRFGYGILRLGSYLVAYVRPEPMTRVAERGAEMEPAPRPVTDLLPPSHLAHRRPS